MSNAAPFDVLIDLARKCQSSAHPLPERSTTTAHWAGLGITLMDQRFVVPLNEVDEQVRTPQVTRIPGVKVFVSGIANVRGRLMTIVDLPMFFGVTSNFSRAQRRTLVVDQNDRYVGFMVDESLGMQHFPSEAFQETLETEVDERIKPYVRGCFRTAGNEWPVLSLHTLTADQELEKLAS